MDFEEKITGRQLVTGEETFDEVRGDLALRPKRLQEYIGQEQLKRSLSVFLEAARKRGEPLDHTLFHGFPGLGKTTLAYIIANEMGAGIKVTSGPFTLRTTTPFTRATRALPPSSKDEPSPVRYTPLVTSTTRPGPTRRSTIRAMPSS